MPAELADCGALEVSCHVSNWFYDLVTGALEPLMGWLGARAFHTPAPGGGVVSLWEQMLQTTTVLYLLAVLAGGVAVMSHESLQQRYSAREILPRLVIGFVAAHASLWISREMIAGSNGIAAGVAAMGIDAGRAATRFQKRLDTLLVDATVFIVLMLVVVIVLLVVWCVMEAVRIAMTITLVVAAPLLLAFHALPYTQRLAALWWRSMAGVLAMPVAQSLAFSTLMRVAFQGETHVIDESSEDWLVSVSLLLTVLYIQLRVPFWIMRLVWQNNVGSSPLAAAVRTAVMALVFRRVLPSLGRGSSAAASSGSGGGSAAAAGRSGPRRGSGAAGAAGRPSGSGGPGGTRVRRLRSPSQVGSPQSHAASHRGEEDARSTAAGAPPRPALGSRRTSGTRPSGSTGGEVGPPTRPNGGTMASPDPAPTNQGRDGVQLPLFARPRRWRQGVLPTPPPTRVPGRRTTQRQGEAPAPRSGPEEPPQPGPGQQALFPAPRPAPSVRPHRPRVAEPPPAPRGARRRTTQRWGDVAPDPPEQQPAQPGRGQRALFPTPRTPPSATSAQPQSPRRSRADPSAARPRPQAPRRPNRRKDDDA
ncbi:type IV secretion system protein [Streptomonospora salina]|uniref:Putative membrane protein YqjE n=1 Tax=Streptomonospora salina TaxID=104205 RepID=A0A841EAN8_9ACTN|nr:type IV secretion system protein [Streptomonospora salina]MBB6000066.1 putative membrane protein YqjE [Streptomonospora salina]